MPEKLPEEFAPTGPKLSKFRIIPAPPMRPHLFPDEARFALRLSVLVAGTELAAWAWLAAAGHRRALIALGFLRLLKPLWSKLGTRLPRPAVAFVPMFVAAFAALAFGGAAALVAVGLPALGDLCASCIGDSVTVERRAAAWAWLDMGAGFGGVLGVAIGAAFPAGVPIASSAALVLAAIGVPDLHDRGTPRSSWPAAASLHTLRTPLGWQLTLLAFACGLLFRQPYAPRWAAFVLPLAGMALAARIEPRMPNAIWLPRLAVVMAALGLAWPPLRLFALGVMFAAIPAAVVRGAGEMERPLASSLAWSALILGAALGAAI